MSLRHAILAILEKNNATGYEIAKQFEGDLRFCWQTSHQLIYRELSKLTKEKLVYFSLVGQAGKPDKKRYELTDAGEQELFRWLESPIKLANPNDSFAIKLFSGQIGCKDSILTELKSQRAEHRQRLQQFRQFENHHFPQDKRLPRDKRWLYLTLRKSVLMEEAWQAWADEAELMLERM